MLVILPGAVTAVRNSYVSLMRSRRTAPRMPLMNAGAPEPQKRLAVSIASSIAPSGEIGWSLGTTPGYRISSNPTRRIDRSSGDPLQRPVGRVPADQVVDLGLMLEDLLGQREGERVDVPRQGLPQGTAEQVALIERPDRGPALVGSSHGASLSRR